MLGVHRGDLGTHPRLLCLFVFLFCIFPSWFDSHLPVSIWGHGALDDDDLPRVQASGYGPRVRDHLGWRDDGKGSLGKTDDMADASTHADNTDNLHVVFYLH